MRHEFNSQLPNGQQDHAFPPVGRDLKSRLDEVVRCVMWHRIALPFSINKTENYVDTAQLYDYWVMDTDETWMKDHSKGYKDAWQAPAIIARELEKPKVSLTKGDSISWHQDIQMVRLRLLLSAALLIVNTLRPVSTWC